MNNPDGVTIMEGVGDEVFHAIGLLLVIFIPLLVAYLNRIRLDTGLIHPEHEEQVQQTRTQLTRGQPDSPANGQPAGEGSEPQGQGVPRRQYNADLTCPICLQEKECIAETNCGHVFCGNCLIAYWRHGNWLGAINCPVCRQMVTIILPLFTGEEENSDEGRRVMGEIRDYNRRFSGEPRPYMDYIYDLPTLLRHVWREFFSARGFIWMFRFRILVCLTGAVLYLLSPLDIIPEAVFGVIGLIDDVFIILLFCLYISIIYRNIVAARTEF